MNSWILLGKGCFTEISCNYRTGDDIDYYFNAMRKTESNTRSDEFRYAANLMITTTAYISRDNVLRKAIIN
jgi:hypothetical protein